MTTVDVDAGIYQRLIADADVADLAGGRVYAGWASQGAGYPRITLRRISARRSVAMLGPVGLVASRLQIDMWGEEKADVKSLARSVRESLDGYRGALGDETAQLVMLLDEHESEEARDDGGETPIYRIRHDYQITHEESRPNRLG